MLLVTPLSIPSQVNFWHRVQIHMSEFGMRPATVNAMQNFELLHALRDLCLIPRRRIKTSNFDGTECPEPNQGKIYFSKYGRCYRQAIW